MKNSENSREQLNSIVDDLCGLVDGIGTFLLDYVERLDRSANALQSAGGSDGAEGCEAQANSSYGSVDERERIETQLQQREAEISEQLRLLEEAWLRLESEQRRFLNSQQGSTNDPPPQSREQRRTQNRALATASESPMARCATGPSAEAIRDFKKLKQEILSAKLYSSNGGR